jgi:serine/threonine-protein kinase
MARIRARVGTVLNRKYRLDALLGAGGMGAVFAATHRNGSRVAIKMLHPEYARIDAVRDRFLREGYAANHVGHAGVARVLDDDDVHGEPNGVFLVLELLEGETLDKRLARSGGVLPVDVVLDLAAQLLDVLSTAHSNGVIHRDIKPENLFLTHAGPLKVMDFGIARLLDGTSATASGELMGTPAFMAPEQAAGRARDIDPRTDVWSVGALMFTLLSGRPVHEGTGPAQVIFAATTPARSLGRIAPQVPADVTALVDRALLFDKTERWPGARAMLAAVHGLRAARRGGAA